MNETDQRHLASAYDLACCSRDPSSQNGAVLVTPDREIILGFNHFYKGIPENYEDRTAKLQGIEHAERDAIYTAAYEGVCTDGAALYCPWIACRECARAILGSGVERVVCHRERMDLTDERWQADIDEALGWLLSAGVRVDYYDGRIPNVAPIRVSGRLWSPSSLQFVGGEND